MGDSVVLILRTIINFHIKLTKTFMEIYNDLPKVNRDKGLAKSLIHVSK